MLFIMYAVQIFDSTVFFIDQITSNLLFRKYFLFFVALHLCPEFFVVMVIKVMVINFILIFNFIIKFDYSKTTIIITVIILLAHEFINLAFFVIHYPY